MTPGTSIKVLSQHIHTKFSHSYSSARLQIEGVAGEPYEVKVNFVTEDRYEVGPSMPFVIENVLTELSGEYSQNMDQEIERFARISTYTANQHSSEREPGKLIDYCLRQEPKHWSIFEQHSIRFLIAVPHYVMHQILRHNSFRFLELSERYSSAMNVFYSEPFRIQAQKNLQCSGEPVEFSQELEFKSLLIRSVTESYGTYKTLLYRGCSREQARAVLPDCRMKMSYMTGTVRSWLTYLIQRLHPHAQRTHQLVAWGIYQQLQKVIPLTMKSFKAHSLTKEHLELIAQYEQHPPQYLPSIEFFQIMAGVSWDDLKSLIKTHYFEVAKTYFGGEDEAKDQSHDTDSRSQDEYKTEGS